MTRRFSLGHALNRPSQPLRPMRHLIIGQRENYLKFGVPLYEASIKCDWKAAKAILDEHPEFVTCSITDNGETALHVAASVNRSSKLVEKFVQNLVQMMDVEDLALQNENFNTAFYLAAAAGNIKTVKIMLEKNMCLALIPGGSGGRMMPLYVAAMYGNYEVVKYLYESSIDLCADCWNLEDRGLLLEKCVEADMFDIALKIVKKYSELGNASVLGILARKPNAIYEKKSDIIKRSINSDPPISIALYFLFVGNAF